MQYNSKNNESEKQPLVTFMPVTPMERAVRDIVGSYYDLVNKQTIGRFNPCRKLTVMAMPTGYQYAKFVSIALTGSTPRGLIIMSIAHHPNEGHDLLANRGIPQRDYDVLLNFIEAVSEWPFFMVPCDFFWSSSPDRLQ